MASEPGFALWIFRSLRRIMRAVDVHSHRLSAEHNITSPQLVCLRSLVDDGPLPPGALAKLVHLSPSTVVGIIDRLAQKDLVVRERSMKDRRQVLIYVTPKGIDLVQAVPSPLQARLAGGLAELSENEQIEIGRSLERLVELLELESTEETAPLLDIAPIAEASPQEPATRTEPMRPEEDR